MTLVIVDPEPSSRERRGKREGKVVWNEKGKR